MLNFPFSAVLLAGGQSRRMGRDKAGVIIGGEPLWRRQLGILRKLRPEQLFICGRPGAVYEHADCDVITDIVPEAGPLGGLITSLRYASTEYLTVLAVDMPAMSGAFLERLLLEAWRSGQGLIPAGADGIEPLAAVYRADSVNVAEECFAAGKRSMRSLVSRLQYEGRAKVYALNDCEQRLFRNVNTPQELADVEAALKEHP